MGAWSKDSKSHVAHMSGGDFYANEQSAVVAAAGKLANRADRRRRQDHGAQGRRRGDRRRRHRRVGDEPARAHRVLREGDRRRQGQGRAAVAAPQGDDDEGVRSDHVRTRRDARTTRTSSTSTPRRSTTLGVDPDNGIGDVYAKIQKLPAGPARRHRGRHSGRLRVAAAAGDGRFEQGDHQPARAERRDHRRLDAGRDPRVGSDVGTRRQAARHEGDDSRSLVRRHLSGDHRRLQSSTARSTSRRWARCRTSG